MKKNLIFLHTSPVHIATFDRLLAEIDPGIPVQHMVDEGLLREARAVGGISPELAGRVTQTVLRAAANDAAVIVCTCSTIGGCAEQASQQADCPVVRVDRAMADQAVRLGELIIVVAALASTLTPTRHLLMDVAQRSAKRIHIIEVLCQSAWTKFERGDHAGYIQDIAQCLRKSAKTGDVIVLAQASMADAARMCADLTIPILSSPRLGLEAAINLYYQRFTGVK